MKLSVATLLSFSLCLSSCATTSKYAVRPETGAQLFRGLGDFHRKFSTSSEEANEFLVQGALWVQAFNYDEADRSFREAARLDPDCAMAWWGVAYAAGPSYNHSILDEERKQASWHAIQEAQARIDHASPLERALIEALSLRFADPYPDNPAPLNRAYADAMGRVWSEHPNDAWVGLLYAEARMVLRPWALYNADREPVEGTVAIEALLERILELDPDLPGALHMYIHAVERSKTPERGLAVADRLSKEVPLSGHLLHMPAHIYTHTGRWERAVEQNALAMEADARYRALSPDQFTQYSYQVHNNHIRAYAAMMTGRESEAMHAARRMWTDIPADRLPDVAPRVDHWMSAVYDVQKRFGRWDELLAEPEPPAFMPYTRCLWHAHRAIAYAAKKDFPAAEAELEAYRRERTGIQKKHLRANWSVKMAQGRLRVIEHFVPGEIALQRGDYDTAIRLLETAKAAEDTLGYGGEPPAYLQPVRHTLGALYMKAGNLREAERAYREDLAEFPRNGWSLYGLSRVLRERGRMEEAREVEERYAEAWRFADEPLTTSCLCIPSM